MNTCYNPFSLSGKTILVSGASSGIGQATAIECSKMGANVIITARNEARLNVTLSKMEGSGNQAIIADLSNEEEEKELVSKLPQLDGVVCCAGVGDITPSQFATRKKFDRVFDTNFFATVELIRLIQKGKKINKGGSIVAISSIAGINGIGVGNGIYGASKAALSQWMRHLAKELASKKVRVNCLCPGMVKTPLISGVGNITEEQFQKDEELYPLQRYGYPEEIAYACVYFLSDASAWVTGTNFIIDGGLNFK